VSASLPRAVAVVGPTGAGKSELGLELAERLAVPVLVCDSVKVYRRLDVGSAKPSSEARRRVPHHLIDLADPDDAFSAGDYARVAWDQVSRTGGVFVGGTGFYLRAVGWTHSGSEDGAAGVAVDDPERIAFDAAWEQREHRDRGSAHRALEAIDSATAREVHPHNFARVLRSLWLCHIYGGPVSQIRREDPPRARMELLLIVCDPGTEALRPRIERRLDQMLAAGWLAEVEQLVADGYDARHKAMRSLGYRQLLEVVSGRMDLGAARETILTATWQYARRQRTYVRHQLPASAVMHVADAKGFPWERVTAFMRGEAASGAGGCA